MSSLLKSLMPRWAYVLTSDGQRKTRLHTLRGELVPVSDILRLPMDLLARLAGRPATGPWMNRAVVRWFAENASPEWRVLELGGGSSTLWWANRVALVHTLESDARWMNTISEGLVKSGLDERASLELVSVDEIRDALIRLPADSYDLVIVDASESFPGQRVLWAELAMQVVRPGGYVVLDDSDHPDYALTDRLASLPLLRFRGMKRHPLLAFETSVIEMRRGNGR